MRVKMVVHILITFFLLTAFAYAQEWPSADRIVSKLQIELNLEKEQLDQVTLIIEENMAKRQQVTPQLTEGLTQVQSQPLDRELYRKLSGVLTKPQMSQWNGMLRSMLQDMNPTYIANNE